MGETIAERIHHIDELATEDKVLYNDRRQPLEVVESGDDKVLLEGPQGGEYVLFHAPDNPDLVLVAKPGHREYASKVNNLRTVGVWKHPDETTWHHTGTGAIIRIVKTDAGYWTLEVEDFDDADPDLPQYGFTEREGAVEEAEKLVRKFPEG